MPLENVYFVFIFLALALLFSFACFTSMFRGQWVVSIVASLFWMLFGAFSIVQDPVFYFQRELVILWFALGFVVLFSPVWYKVGQKEEDQFEKDAKAEETSHRKWWGDVDERNKRAKTGKR